MKSNAPRRVASTAVEMSPWPEITTIGVASTNCRTFCRTSRPSMPGILTSRNTRSGASRSISLTPSSPVAASVTSLPSYSSVIFNESRTAASSSMTRMRGFTVVSPGLRADGADGALIELGFVEIERQHIARARGADNAAEAGDRIDRLPIDLEDDRAAIDAAVVSDGQRLNALHQQAGHA